MEFVGSDLRKRVKISRSPLRRKMVASRCFLKNDTASSWLWSALRLQFAGTKKRTQALATGTRENIIMLDKAPNGKVSDLLSALDKALCAGEVDHAVDLFQADCYWRDLVTFTWNIKTMEGKDKVREMLKARLAETNPPNGKM